MLSKDAVRRYATFIITNPKQLHVSAAIEFDIKKSCVNGLRPYCVFYKHKVYVAHLKVK